MKITKNDIIAKVADRLACTPAQSISATEAVFGAIQQALAAGEEIRIHGFGKFFLRSGRASRADLDAKSRKSVAFKAFSGLLNSIGGLIQELPDLSLWHRPPAERRKEPRVDAGQDATAIVRISGIPVCEFRLKSASAGGGSFWVEDDSVVLRNIRVGQEIEIHIQPENATALPVLQRSRIVHITRAPDPGYFILGVEVLGKL